MKKKGDDVQTLTGQEFINLLVILPIVFGFVTLGIIIVWKVTSNPSEIAPHLDVILLAFAIFSNPVSIIIGAVCQKMLHEHQEKARNNLNNVKSSDNHEVSA
jgi:hypothetical protein